MSKRTHEIDVIRLAALIGICIVNIPVMALSTDAFFHPPTALIDRLGSFLVAGFFQLKFFLLFSFVFGWGVHIQQRVALSREQSFKQRYFRRMIGLGTFGVAHAMLVFNGDILLPYSVLGAVFWFVKDCSVASLLRLAKWMIPLSVCSLTVFALLFELAGLNDEGAFTAFNSGRGAGFLETLKTRMSQWPVTFVFILIVQGPLVFGAFAVGLAAAKSNFLQEHVGGMKLLKEKLPMLLAVAVPLNLLYACGVCGFIPKSLVLLELLGFVLIPIGATAMAAVYLYLFLRISQSRQLPRVFVQAGQNSLSAYVLQGIFAGFVFNAYGLGYFDKLGQAMLLPVSVVIAITSILSVGWYAQVFGRGPLEPLLRRISG